MRKIFGSTIDLEFKQANENIRSSDWAKQFDACIVIQQIQIQQPTYLLGKDISELLREMVVP